MRKFLGVLCAVLLGASGEAAAKSYDYRIVVANEGAGPIADSEVLDGAQKHDYGGGYVAQYSHKTHAGPMATPPNDIFTIRWKDLGGKRREQAFDLRRRVKSSFSGELVFILGPHGDFMVKVFDKQGTYRRKNSK